MRERRGQRRDAPSLSPHDKWSCSQNEGVRCNPKQTAAASCVCVSLSLCPVNKLEGLPEESARAYQLIPHTGPHHCTWGARMKLCVCVCEEEAVTNRLYTRLHPAQTQPLKPVGGAPNPGHTHMHMAWRST